MSGGSLRDASSPRRHAVHASRRGIRLGPETPEEAGLTLALRISFTFLRWKGAALSTRSAEYRARRFEELHHTLRHSSRRLQAATYRELLLDDQAALVQWAKCHVEPLLTEAPGTALAGNEEN